ncbi:unnamed protein product, partial [Oppiella nova]
MSVAYHGSDNGQPVLKRSSIDSSVDIFGYSTKSLSFPLIIVQLFLSCFADSTQDITSKIPEKCCPKTSASFLSKLTFSWFTPMIMKGYRKPLTTQDMWTLEDKNQTSVCVERFNRYWKPIAQNKDQEHINILIPILRTFWPTLTVNSLIKLTASLLQLTQPLLLDRLLTYLTSQASEPEWTGYSYAVLMFVCPMMASILDGQYEYRQNVDSMRIKSCIVSKLYEKSIMLSSSGRKEFTSGEIINLISVDMGRVHFFLKMYNTLWLSPIQICVSIALLWKQLGVSSLAGIAFMATMIPINTMSNNKLDSLWTQLLEWKDKRVMAINEILNNIKVIKLYAWEQAFMDNVHKLREQETNVLDTYIKSSTWTSFTLNASGLIVSVLSFTAFTFSSDQNILDANKAFVSLSLFTIIVIIRRINKYLNGNEVNDKFITNEVNEKNPIIVKNGSFKWDKESNDKILKNINLIIERNSLVAVVGQVGAGKSSLLSALLGNMEKTSGEVNISGTVAYVSQQAWIQNTTLRQNILFVNEYNQRFYEKVLDSCALRPDLEILLAKDMTEIGEKGINLSGGQKQRVSLARAVYSDADIYLLDDPLSAVDAHVGRQLFDETIGPKGILRKNTRILVTHKASVLPEVDKIIVLKKGLISEFGSFNELMAKSGEFAEFIAEYVLRQESEGVDIDDEKELEMLAKLRQRESEGVDIDDEKELEMLAKLRQRVKPIIERQESRNSLASDGLVRRQGSHISTTTDSEDQKIPETGEQSQDVLQNDGKLMDEEKPETGSVKTHVYKQYFRWVGVRYLIVILLSYIIANTGAVASGLWLSKWSADALDPQLVDDYSLRLVRLGLFAGFCIVEMVFIFSAQLSISLGCMGAAKRLHRLMMERMMRAPVAYFDTTPVGRIVSRFSEDMELIDSELLFDFRLMCLKFFSLIVSMGMISLETPLIMLAILPIIVTYVTCQRIYTAGLRQIRRLISTSSSHIISHFGETFNGTSTIRAYGAKQHFLRESHRRIDESNACAYQLVCSQGWLAIRLELLGYSIVFLSALFAVVFRETVSAGVAALAISYALNITTLIEKFIFGVTETETDILAVERCLKFMEMPSEAEWFNDRTKPPPDWPLMGGIVFSNYSTKYRQELDLVLKNITLDVKPRERLAIVGRTGAGKSSLALALFRLIEAKELQSYSEPSLGTNQLIGAGITLIDTT